MPCWRRHLSYANAVRSLTEVDGAIGGPARSPEEVRKAGALGQSESGDDARVPWRGGLLNYHRNVELPEM